MHILANHDYQYRPTNMRCTVTEIFPDRHRAIIRLADGRVIQEVPYSDLLEPLAETPTPPPPPAPAPAPPVEPEEPSEAEAEPPSGLMTPRRFGQRLRGE